MVHLGYMQGMIYNFIKIVEKGQFTSITVRCKQKVVTRLQLNTYDMASR